MYCPNCGNDMKEDKFCTKCGFNKEERNMVGSTPVYNSTVVNTSPTQPAKSGKGAVTGIILAIVFFIILVVGICAVAIIFAFKLIGNIATKTEVLVNDISIPSVYSVLDKKIEVCGYSGSFSADVDKVVIDYCGELSDEDEQKYVDHLIEKENFELYEGSYKYNLKKDTKRGQIRVVIDNNDRITYAADGTIFESTEDDELDV